MGRSGELSGEVDLGLLGIAAVKEDGTTEDLNEFGLGILGEGGGHLFAFFFFELRELELDQFVGFEALDELLDHIGGDALFAEQEARFEVVSEGA